MLVDRGFAQLKGNTNPRNQFHLPSDAANVFLATGLAEEVRPVKPAVAVATDWRVRVNAPPYDQYPPIIKYSCPVCNQGGHGETLHLRRSVWRTHVSDTKTVASTGSVPLLPDVVEGLEAHRKTSTSEFIFAGGTGRPLVLANVTRRDIAPTLEEKNIPWHGWHGFRRGLASNLHELGVPDKVIQGILRHADEQVTQRHYIKTRPVASDRAMRKLGRAFRRVRKTLRKNAST